MDGDTIWVAAQRGDVAALEKFISSGEYSASARDPQNITPLHWAAINAQLAACQYLLDNGADVDALGGDLVATPLQWAARNGYLYIIHLLVRYGADVSISDSQGYNSLHLVTHSSGIMPLLYLLHQPINVDSKDSQGHTSLMWAAYQGDALSVDLLLKHGANPNTKDDSGLTPLHWAVVRANRGIIRRLVEAGSDVSARDGENRTPRDMAIELKSLGAWKRALEEGGMNEYGVRRTRPLSDRTTKIAIFILPTLFLYLIFMTLTILPWYTGLLLAMAEFFGMHHIVTRVLLNSPSYIPATSGGESAGSLNTVSQSPYFAGIIFGSFFWVGVSWVTRLVKQTEHPLVNLAFAITLGLCMYNFFRAVMLDPGTCPRPGRGEDGVKSIIEDLASEGRLNGQTFCVQCMARKPLRSKHCKTCDRCIARHDHHCPWVWNCVGVNNHRQFVMFVTTLVLGVILFDYLVWEFYEAVAAKITPGTPATGTPPTGTAADPQVSPSCVLSKELCLLTAHDTFLLAVTLWATLQLTWTSILLVSQFWQIAKQMTTLEVSNLGRYGFMGGRGGASLSGQMGALRGHAHGQPNGPPSGLTTGGEGDAASGISGASSPAVASLASLHSQSTNGTATAAHSHSSSFIMSLLGLDRFTKGKAVSGLSQTLSSDSKAKNPFDMGSTWGNCRDFWSTGRELGVDYTRVYDVPEEGFIEAKRRRIRNGHDPDDRGGIEIGGDEDDDLGSALGTGFSIPKTGAIGSARSLKGMIMGLGSGNAGGSGGRGYEPVSQV